MKVYVDVFCTVQFAAYHFWEDATPEVSFLRYPHRHVFHVTLWKSVDQLDRGIEFITLKQAVTKYVREKYEERTIRLSCEQIAADILLQFDGSSCKVSEDGENGAQVSIAAHGTNSMEIEK